MDDTGRVLLQKRLMNVFIIDDEKIILTALNRVLSGAGYTVHSFESGEGVLDKAKELGPDFVFLDVKMPGVSGTDLLKDLKRELPGIKIIMMSGYTTPESIQTAKDLGADSFLKKPFDNVFDILKVVEQFSS